MGQTPPYLGGVAIAWALLPLSATCSIIKKPLI
jgi:hypothetical protein